jgi:LytS/YehU family sensor histidine kinase
MQLHPHFLFNTLHSISTLMHRDVDEADRTLLKLSDLLRRIIESTRTQKVTLSEELAFLRAYLDIEQVRFGDRLTVTYDVSEEAATEDVPNLVLQPLIENAIRHGFQPSGRPFALTIRARTSGDRLTVVVSDSGVGLPDGFDETDYGVGLRLTKERLRLLYGPAATLTLSGSENGGTSARIELPTVD